MFDRVLVDPPCTGLGTLRSHPDLRWRVMPVGGRRGWPPSRTRSSPPRGATCAPAGASSTPSARSRRGRSGSPERSQRRLWPHEDDTRRLLYCDAMADRRRLPLGMECPACHEPWLRPSNLAGRYRCVNCLHRFELRSVCPRLRRARDDRAHGRLRERRLQRLRRQHARRGMTRQRRPLDPRGRLRPAARAGRGGRRRRRARDPRRRHGRPLRPAAVDGAGRGRGAARPRRASSTCT